MRYYTDSESDFTYKGNKMAHFAKVENGTVTQVIVADQEFINSGAVGDPSAWIQTSYNTRGGVHYGQDGEPDGGVALRKNYAGIGYTYDAVLDAFIPPQPFPSWVLDEQAGVWQAPVAMPEDNKRYQWDEEAGAWTEVVDQPPV
jgi:hypothetical protein